MNKLTNKMEVRKTKHLFKYIVLTGNGHDPAHKPKFLTNQAQFMVHKPQFMRSCLPKTTHEPPCFSKRIIQFMVHESNILALMNLLSSCSTAS